jgi:hypothetical protein
MARKNKSEEHAQTFRLPSDVWQGLCRSAETNLRSRNGELVWILREWFKQHPPDRPHASDHRPTNLSGAPPAGS